MQIDLEASSADGGFEMVDYSKATEWEHLIAAVEQTFRRWKLDGQPVPGSAPQAHPNPLTETLTTGGGTGGGGTVRKRFTLRYHWSPQRRDCADLMDLMDSVTDFSSYGHPLARWFGFPSFVTLESHNDHQSVDEATMLLSTLAIAADNAGVAEPLFVPFGRGRPRDYMGYLLAPSSEMVAHFSCKAARPPPHLRGAVDLQWLVTRFCERLQAPVHDTRVAVAIHCTWRALMNPFAGWQQPIAQAPGSRHRECLWGPDADPVRMLELATTCQLLLEQGLGSLASQSQLAEDGTPVPERCPHWSLLAETDKEDPERRKEQAPMAASFELLLEAMSEAEGFASVKQSAEHRPMLETLTRSLLEPTSSLVPTSEELSKMISELFDSSHASMQFVAAVVSDVGRATLPNIKGAPPLTLLASLCMYLLNVEGLAAVSVVWLEFTKELRWHWDHFELLPRVPFDVPAHDCCAVYQRLQMLNWCIARRREHNERATTKAALGGWDDVDFDSVSSEEGEEKEEAEKQSNAAAQPTAQPLDVGGRQGVREQLTLRLLPTGEFMCAPHTQEPQTFVTEDMMAEQQALLLSLGSDRAGSEMRAQMQAQSLVSDMEAFRAANPGCVIEDFVRWHSERDWVVEECREEGVTPSHLPQPDGSWVYADERTGKCMRGRMSARMGEAGNLWHVAWSDARAVPASRQKPLVDYVREGERTLHHLESMEPQALLRQCALVALGAMHHLFSVLPSSRVPAVSQQLSLLAAAMIDVGSETCNPNLATLGPEDLQPCLVALDRVERVSACAASLLSKLGNNVDLVNSVLKPGTRALVEDDDERAVVRRLFTEAHLLPPPHAREYLLRSLRGPKSTLPNRLYAHTGDEGGEVRLCWALTSGDRVV